MPLDLPCRIAREVWSRWAWSGIRMLGLLRDLDAGALRIGLPVRAFVETVPGGAAQPVFRPA